MTCHRQESEHPSPMKKSTSTTPLNSQSNFPSWTRSTRHRAMGSWNPLPVFKTSSKAINGKAKSNLQSTQSTGARGQWVTARRKQPSSEQGTVFEGDGIHKQRLKQQQRRRKRQADPRDLQNPESYLRSEEKLADCMLTATFQVWFRETGTQKYRQKWNYPHMTEFTLYSHLKSINLASHMCKMVLCPCLFLRNLRYLHQKSYDKTTILVNESQRMRTEQGQCKSVLRFGKVTICWTSQHSSGSLLILASSMLQFCGDWEGKLLT